MRALGGSRATLAAMRWPAAAVLALGVASPGLRTASASTIVHDGDYGLSSGVGPSFWAADSFSSSAAGGYDGFTRSRSTSWTLEDPEHIIVHILDVEWRICPSPGFGFELGGAVSVGTASALSRIHTGYPSYDDFDVVACTLALTAASLSFYTRYGLALPMPRPAGALLWAASDAPTFTDAGWEFARLESHVELACSLEGGLVTVGPPVLEPSRLLPFAIGAIVMALVQRRRK